MLPIYFLQDPHSSSLLASFSPILPIHRLQSVHSVLEKACLSLNFDWDLGKLDINTQDLSLLNDFPVTKPSISIKKPSISPSLTLKNLRKSSFNRISTPRGKKGKKSV